MSHQENKNKDYFDISDFLVVIAKNFHKISLFTFLTIILSVIYLFLRQDLFISTSKITSSHNTGGQLSQMSNIASSFGITNPFSNSNEKYVYTDLIRSRYITLPLLEEKVSVNGGKYLALYILLTNSQDLHGVSEDQIKEIAHYRLLDMIKVNEDKKSGIFTINIVSDDPLFSYEINSRLIKSIDTHQKSHFKQKSFKTRLFIEKRISETKIELTKSENDLKSFMDSNRRIENSPTLLLEQQRLQRDVNVLTQVFTALKQQLESTKIEEVRDSDYVVIVDPPNIPLKTANANPFRVTLFAALGSFFISLLFVTFSNSLSKIDSSEKEKLSYAKNILFDKFVNIFKSNV